MADDEFQARMAEVARRREGAVESRPGLSEAYALVWTHVLRFLFLFLFLFLAFRQCVAWITVFTDEHRR